MKSVNLITSCDLHLTIESYKTFISEGAHMLVKHTSLLCTQLCH